MANPQTEHGYTKIANELLEAIYRSDMGSEELRVFLFIIRMTYGYGRKVIKLRTKDIISGSGVRKQNINRALNKLLSSNRLLGNQVEDKQGVSYSIQKDYDKWKSKPWRKKVVLKLRTKSNQIEDKKEITPISIKERKKKKKIYKRKSPRKPKPPESVDLVVKFFDENGFTEESAINAFNYYADNNWHDSRGSPVLSWKQKMRGIWFRDENKKPRELGDF